VLTAAIDLAVVDGIVAASARYWGTWTDDDQWVIHGLPALAGYHQVRCGFSFGTEWSDVQILSPRPILFAV
jgi:hypothetical protein